MRYFSFKLNFSLVENSPVTTRKTRLWRRRCFLDEAQPINFHLVKQANLFKWGNFHSNLRDLSGGHARLPLKHIDIFLFIYLFFKFFCSLFCFVLVVVVVRWYWEHRERPESDLCEKELKTCLSNADVFPVVERRWGSFFVAENEGLLHKSCCFP